MFDSFHAKMILRLQDRGFRFHYEHSDYDTTHSN